MHFRRAPIKLQGACGRRIFRGACFMPLSSAPFPETIMGSRAVTRQGTIAEKNTVGDASPEARAHQMSVEVNIAETEFMGDKLTIVDCPGSVEFAFEAEAVIGGVDLAVVVAEADAKKIPA